MIKILFPQPPALSPIIRFMMMTSTLALALFGIITTIECLQFNCYFIIGNGFALI